MFYLELEGLRTHMRQSRARDSTQPRRLWGDTQWLLNHTTWKNLSCAVNSYFHSFHLFSSFARRTQSPPCVLLQLFVVTNSLTASCHLCRGRPLFLASGGSQPMTSCDHLLSVRDATLPAHSHWRPLCFFTQSSTLCWDINASAFRVAVRTHST